ncbi:MAG: CoA-binding protein [Thermodesulfobacteriota bacterium]
MLVNLAQIRQLLATSRTVAVVGLSPKESRPSNMVARYLVNAGFHVVPVNPGQETILGLPCYPDLAAIPEPVEIVDIFRRAEEVGPVVDEAIRLGARAVWMQEGIVNEAAAAKARAAGLIVVMDRCIKTDHQQLLE